MASSFQWVAYQERTNDKQFTLTESDRSTTLVLAATDKVRFKLGSLNQTTPSLDLEPDATANGSRVTVDDAATGLVTVRLAGADLADFHPGTYRGEFTIADDSEVSPADANEHTMLGVVTVVGTLGGNTGL